MVVASGNDGLSHRQGRFRDLDGDGRHDFTATDDTIIFEAYEGEYLDLILRWEDPCQPSTNDYELILYDDDGFVVADSDYDNALDASVEELFDEIPYDGIYHLVIEKAPSAQSVDLDLVWANGPELEQAVAVGSVSYFEPAVLVKQAYPNFAADQLQQFLEDNADDLGAAGKDNVYGAGLVKRPPPP